MKTTNKKLDIAKKIKKDIWVGKKIYVGTSLYISRGSDDFVGGVATISKIIESISGGKKCRFIVIEERPGTEYNWDQCLAKEQARLKKEFGKKKAHSDPDEDTPWIQDGDFVNGSVYHGPDVR